MRLPVPRSRGPALASLAALTAAALLSGCGGSGGSSGPPGPTRRTGGDSARPSADTSSPGWARKHDSVRSVAAVGDSISRGFDACSVLSDCPQVSWVTGTDTRVRSLASRALRTPGRARPAGTTVPRSWNLARSGARMSELPRQVARAVGKKPDMVTVLIGSNDACRNGADAMTPVEDFRASFEESLETLHEELPRTRVLVGSVPDLEQVWRVGRNSPMAKRVWGLGVCPAMLARAGSDTAADRERRAAVSRRVDAYNAVLEDVCARYRTCRWDGGAVHRYRFTADKLSPWDWFHPSVRGQAALARIMYRVAFEES